MTKLCETKLPVKECVCDKVELYVTKVCVCGRERESVRVCVCDKVVSKESVETKLWLKVCVCVCVCDKALCEKKMCEIKLHVKKECVQETCM